MRLVSQISRPFHRESVTCLFLLAGFVLTTSLDLAPLSQAQDWPEAQGPTRDNISSETGLLSEWPDGGPVQAWKIRSVGLGYSGPAIVGDRIYIMGARAGKTEMFALKVTDGSELWSIVLNEKPFDFKGNSWGIGPRATPAVSDGMVYGLAADGVLVAATTEGEEKWRINLQKDLGGEVGDVGGGPKTFGWGFCWSPMVDGEKLICTPGGADGTFAALDKKTGEVLWRSTELTEVGTYASPIKAKIEDEEQYITMTQMGVAGVSAEDGKLLWHYQRKRPYSDVVIPTPTVVGNMIYMSTGDGCTLVKVTKTDAGYETESVWSSSKARNMKNELGGFVILDGQVYGTSDRRGWDLCPKGPAEWMFLVRKRSAERLRTRNIHSAGPLGQ
ncbi:MAG: PQQ-binding-like beta-propeller repeat protein, partial [Planctomycetota bacterium]